MPSSKSALKSHRKSLTRREHNRGRRSAMRTSIKKTLQAVEAGDLEAAEKNLVAAQKMIDKNAKWNQLHSNTAARRKSNLAKAVQALRAQKRG